MPFKTTNTTTTTIKTKKAATVKNKSAFGNEAIAKKPSGFKTVTQLATALNVSNPTAANYINRLNKTRKVESKEVRQGKRGPLAVAYRAP